MEGEGGSGGRVILVNVVILMFVWCIGGAQVVQVVRVV